MIQFDSIEIKSNVLIVYMKSEKDKKRKQYKIKINSFFSVGEDL